MSADESLRAHLLSVADPRAAASSRLFLTRVINYVTNHAIAHVPSHRLRIAWYRHVVGARIGTGSAIQLGCYLWFFGPRQMRRSGLVLGQRTIVNRRCCLDARGGLTIGDDVSISAESVVLTAGHRHDDPGFPLETRSTRVADKVWIGMRAMIMPGVSVGYGAVVAAGSVVTNDVAPMTVVAGAPARAVGRRASAGTNYELRGLRTFLE